MSNLSTNVDIVLLVFGLGSVIGLWFVGVMVDRKLQFLAVETIIVFAFSALLLGLWGNFAQVVYFSILIWGFAFGGFATITQTALSRFADNSVDVAQAMYTTSWNTAVACGGVVGGILLDKTGISFFPWVVIGFLAISLSGTILAINKKMSK